MVFMGNPGTGKTTVARLIGQMYHSLGLLARGHLVEVARADLVAGFVGQTALKTLEKVQAALDGVLFIDEAYTLVQSSQDAFGNEALNTLVKAIEENSQGLLVIAAGYPKEMRQFLSVNPGLASRLPLQLSFQDFSVAELTSMFAVLAQQHGFHLSPDFEDHLSNVVVSHQMAEGNSFGNGRLVHSLFEQARRSLAGRVLPMLRETTLQQPDTDALAFISTFIPDDLGLKADNSIPDQDNRYFFLPSSLPAPASQVREAKAD
jgi:replication-associated recombination protein RarA